MPSDPLLSKALNVLAKAESTPFGEERSALVYGSYVLLARYLAANPAPPGPEGRRRERRLVADRRRRSRAPAEGARSRPVAYQIIFPSPDPDRGQMLDERI